MRREFLAPSLLTYYRDPVMIVEGSMQWLFDETGRRYLDFFGGIVTVSVGHCHPRVVEKVREQVERLQHTTTIYLHPTIAEFLDISCDPVTTDGECRDTPAAQHFHQPEPTQICKDGHTKEKDRE